MLKVATKRTFGLFGSLKKLAQTPLKYTNEGITESYGDNNPLGNLTEKFDDEAAEWKSVVVGGSFELNSFQHTDQNIQPNFGTLDNPHLIFTSDIPYRFVGCTGAPNEDDYEGHEMMYFLLREGPLQRCMCCGQVFKLVRLRDEQSAQNDYYQNDFVPHDIQEMGESDHWIQFHPIRFMMMHTYEHTHFEVPTNDVITLKNNDEHDRLLVDPAYRLEQLAIAEQKINVVQEVGRTIDNTIYEQHGMDAVEYSKDNYESLIEAEIAVQRLQQHFRAVQRFNIRSVLDPANHERREKRMQERAFERTQASHTLYLNGHSESELQYRDYYESDAEALQELSFDAAAARTQALANPNYQLKNFVFLEQYSRNKTPDSSSYLDKKIFRFNYRQALYSPEDHERKEQRMLARMTAAGFDNLLSRTSRSNAEGQTDSGAKLAFYEMVVDQALENYKNYFESDLEDDFEFVEQLPLSEKKGFAATFDINHLVAAPDTSVASISFPRGEEPLDSASPTFEEVIDNGLNMVQTLRNLTGVNRNQEILEEALRQSLEQRSRSNQSLGN